jgi:hypothetical protein
MFSQKKILKPVKKREVVKYLMGRYSAASRRPAGVFGCIDRRGTTNRILIRKPNSGSVCESSRMLEFDLDIGEF